MARIRSRLNRAFGEKPEESRVVNIRSRGGGRFNSRRFGALADRLSQQQSAFNQQQNQRFARLQRIGERTRSRALKAQNRALTASRGVSAARQEEVTRSGVRQSASLQQSRISRGLQNTTIAGSEERGVASDVSRRRRAIDADQSLRESGILQGTAQLESQLGQFQSDLFLSRSDQNPAFNQTLQLLQQLAQR